MQVKIKLKKLSNEKSDIKNLKTKVTDGKTYIFDIVRKRYILGTPEEWVRQEMLHSLINNYKYPKNLIAVEKKLMVNGMFRRTDIVIHDNLGKPIVLVECKAPKIKIDEAAFNQIAAYNYALKVPYLIVSNLNQTYIMHIDFASKKHRFLENLPHYEEICT